MSVTWAAQRTPTIQRDEDEATTPVCIQETVNDGINLISRKSQIPVNLLIFVDWIILKKTNGLKGRL